MKCRTQPIRAGPVRTPDRQNGYQSVRGSFRLLLEFVSNRSSRSVALTNFNSASVCAERSPCFHALRFPFGAPQLFPPCILHRCFPLTAGERHSVPDLVRAPQRGALARLAGCMGLSVGISNFLAPAPLRGCLESGQVNFSATLRDLPPQATHRQLGRIPMDFRSRRP